MKWWRDRSRGEKIGLALLAPAIVFAVVMAVWGMRFKTYPLDEFDEMAPELRAACATYLSEVESVHGELVHHGRILVVDGEDGTVLDDFHEYLDESLRPSAPEEVEMVLCAGEKWERKVGEYTDGAAAYRTGRAMCALAWPEGTVLFCRDMWNSPPSDKEYAGPGRGRDPLYEIIDEVSAAPEG